MLSRILVAVDDSDDGEKAFNFAALTSKRFESYLLIAHIIEEFGNVGQSILNQLEQDSQRILQKYQSKAENLGLSSSQMNVIEDRGTDVAEKILEIAEKEKIDAIVVGSRGRYLSSETFLIGSTSSKLVHYGRRTIIIVK
jgi:nucleotide-binding universal stress UspA family protein